jgi:hypothetical protein
MFDYMPYEENPITRPHSIIPQGIENTNFLWIKLEAKEMSSQPSFVRGQEAVKTSGSPIIFYFLSPDSWPEDLDHKWEVYESFVSRMSQKVASFKKGAQEAKEVATFAGEALKGFFAGRSKAEQERMSATAAAISAAQSAGGVEAAHYRIDAPLTYQDSERRRYIFLFNLADEGNPQKDIIYPIRMLQKLSCPEVGQGLIDIKLPHIFSIEAIPNRDMLYVEYAALSKVTSTYYGPWMNGYPTRAEVQCDFIDVSPTYKSTFDLPIITSTYTPETGAIPPEERGIDKKNTYIRDRLKNRAISEVFSRGRSLGRSLIRNIVTGE